jgi:glycolate oxidase
VANVFHAGDGNMHPLILFDANAPGELEKAEALGADILRLCVEVGGCLSGEHGVGVEKRDLMTDQFGPTIWRRRCASRTCSTPAGC